MIRLLAIVGAVFCCVSCVSSDAWLNASDSDYPISLTRSILDERGDVYVPLESEIVGDFKRTWRHWSWFSRDVSTDQLSEILAYEIKQQEGDGVVNLRVKVVNPTDYLTAMLFIFPTSIYVTVEGDVIKRNRNGQ